MKKSKKNKIIKILEKNQIITTYFNSIFTFFAILISIWNSTVIINSNQFAKNEVAPAFQIRSYEKDGKKIHELKNLKGFVNNVKFTKYDEITISRPGKNYTIMYICKNIATSKPTSNKWFYQSACSEDLGQKAVKKIEILTPQYNARIHYISHSSYYKIEYQDYKNEFHTEIYTKFNDGKVELHKNNESSSPSILYSNYIDPNDKELELDAKSVLQTIERYQELGF